MFSEVIVPADGSDESARAFGPAARVAHALGVPLRIVSYHAARGEGFDLRNRLRRQTVDLGPVRRTIETAAATKGVTEHLVDVVNHSSDALVVMSTHGHGRSSAIIGSVATALLEETHRPAVLIGPSCQPDMFRLDGPMIVAVTGDAERWDPTLTLAAGFAGAFSYVPSAVEVIDPDSVPAAAGARGPRASDMAPETTMVRRRAAALQACLDRDVNFEVLHNRHPGRALAEYADSADAALIVMATAAGSGLRRLLGGSETADAVRHASCPVLVVAVSSAG